MPPSRSELPPPALRVLGWAAGLPLALAVAAAAIIVAEPGLDARHAQAADALARSLALPGAEPWLRVQWIGRDARALGEAPGEAERSAARHALAALPQLRTLDDRLGLVTLASPFGWRIVRTDRTSFVAQGHRPAEIGRNALAARLVARLPPDGARLVDDTRAARGAAPGFAERAAYAVGLAARLAPGGDVALVGDVLTLNGSLETTADAAALRAALAAPPQGLSIGEVAAGPPRVDPFVWSAARGPAGLRMEGFVPSEAARTRLADAVREAGPGVPVEDRAELARGLPDGVDPAALARLVGPILALLAEGHVDLVGDRLSIVGTAVDGQAVPEIADRLDAGLADAGLRRGRVTVAALPVKPYRTAIRREADRVTLTGHLPDAAAREALLDAVRPRFFGERILDRTRLAPDAPDGLVGALTTGLDALALLASGEVVADDRTLALSGESLYRGTARRLRAAPLPLPPGWAQTIAVHGPEEPEALDLSSCRDRLRRAGAGTPLRFAPGSADLEPSAYPLLDAVAALARICPNGRVEVAGRADPATATAAKEAPAKALPPALAKPAPKAAAAKGGAQRETARDTPAPPPAPDADLPRRRALSVVDYLLKAGVPPERAAVSAAPAEGDEATQLAFAPRS